MQYKYHTPTCGLERISIASIIPIREVQHLLYNMFYQCDTDGFVDTSITPITPNTPAHLHIITGPSSSNIHPHTHIHCFKRHTIKPDNGKEPKKSLIKNLEKVQIGLREKESEGGPCVHSEVSGGELLGSCGESRVLWRSQGYSTSVSFVRKLPGASPF